MAFHNINNESPMNTWFVSRHPGALDWMQQHGPAFDHHVAHLDPQQVQAGDTVIGTLCALDTAPRRIPPEVIETLQRFTAPVLAILERPR